MALASTTNPISPTIARTVIGPLTTTFVQPSECTYFGTNPGVFGAGTSYFQAQSCLVPPSNGQAFDASTCWPPPITDTHTTVFAPEPPFNGWGFYSPAYICPSGYSTACTAAQLSDGASSPIVFPGTEFAFQYPLQPGETAVGCCPRCETPPNMIICTTDIMQWSHLWYKRYVAANMYRNYFINNFRSWILYWFSL